MTPVNPFGECDCERPPDQDMVWSLLREHNIFTWDRGPWPTGPTKLYICPVNPRNKKGDKKSVLMRPYVQFNDDNMGKHDSWWHAFKLRWILVNSKLFRSQLSAKVPDPTRDRTVGQYSFFFPRKKRRLTLSFEIGSPVHPSDIGFTKRVVDVYDFKHPVWFDVIWEKDDTIGSMSSKVILADDDDHWWNCVVDWEDMYRYLQVIDCMRVEGWKTKLPGDPMMEAWKVDKDAKLFSNGKLFKDVQDEVAYLAML